MWDPPATASVTLTLGTNLFYGPMREPDTTIPEQAVFCVNEGGPPPQAFMSYATHGSFKRAFVRVDVRSTLDAFNTGEALAHACARRLMFATLTGYVSCKVLSSQPDYLGSDERGVHGWSFIVELAWREAA